MLKPPAWCEHAVPTAGGWADPDTDEVYIAGSFTPEEIAAFHGQAPEPVMLTEVPVPAPEPEVIMEVTGPEEEKAMEAMSKLELEALGREHGIELDRRKAKATLINRLKGVIGR